MRRTALIAIAIMAMLGTGMAQAELVQHGDLRLDFRAKFAPQELPRNRLAPVSIDVSGSIATVGGERPPELRRIEIGVNRNGTVSTAGLPRCSAGQIQGISTGLARSRCRGALVGTGKFGANVDFPSETPFPVAGKILAFNSVVGGRPAMLLHIFGSRPVNATIVLTFHITHPRRGKFGTIFTARIPKIASDLGYVTDLSLDLGRRYRHGGKRMSFLNARCAAPAGFSGGPFSFARGDFTFANGQELSVTLTRNCQVR